MSWKKLNFKSVSRLWHRILLVILKSSAWALAVAFESEWKCYSSSQSNKKKGSVRVWIQLYTGGIGGLESLVYICGDNLKHLSGPYNVTGGPQKGVDLISP